MERLDPTNRLMAVLDDPAGVDPLVRRLTDVGIPADAVTVLVGDEGAARVDAAGRGGGGWLRLARLVALTQADQSVDLAAYEAALLDGRAVLMMRADGESRERAVEALREAGTHFINYYGRLVTREIVPWRGERLPLPQFLQR